MKYKANIGIILWIRDKVLKEVLEEKTGKVMWILKCLKGLETLLRRLNIIL